MTSDCYRRYAFTEREVCEFLYENPDADLSGFFLHDNAKQNNAVAVNYSQVTALKQLPEILVSPDEWHRQNQQAWHMPSDYANMDIAVWILDQCVGEAEVQRAGAELLEYAERNLLDMLCYLKYLVDTMHKNNIVWGVGRGSSVASFVLYKIGVHRINSLYYDLDFKEFMR